jgi:hypothetical protein
VPPPGAPRSTVTLVRYRAWPWAVAIAAGSAGVLTIYLVVISRQGNSPVGWVVGPLVYAGMLPLVGLTTRWTRRPCFLVSAILLTVLTIVGMLSIGILIFPVAIIAWVAFASIPSGSRSDAPRAWAPPGWYPDPASTEQNRYWDGSMWTAQVAPPGSA